MLSIIIPTLNSEETISHCLSSIFSAYPPSEPFEVLLVDGGSKDKTLEIACKYPVKILICKERGIGIARNLGLREAKGRIVCFTDSDCVVEKRWLDKISDFFSKNREVDGVGGLVLWYKEEATKLQELAGRIFVENQGFPDHEVEARMRSFDGVLFDANCAYKKNVLLSISGFPEPVGLGHELSWKLAQNGKILVFTPNLRVFHIFPKSLQRLFQQQFRWGIYISILKKKYHYWNLLNELVFMVYSTTKAFLLLLDFQDLSRKILHFCQLICWWLGQFYALQFQDFRQIHA